jgi:hypothetical protein
LGLCLWYGLLRGLKWCSWRYIGSGLGLALRPAFKRKAGSLGEGRGHEQ